MDYGATIARAWRITWDNKFLWVLGFLAALGSAGGGGNSGSRFTTSQPNYTTEEILAIGAAVLGLLCVALIVGLIIWLVSLVARGGLISAVARLDSGESVTLGEAFGGGTAVLGRLVGLNLLLFGGFILALVLMGVVAATGGGLAALAAGEGPDQIAAGFGILAICFVALLCLLVPAGIVVSFIAPFSFRGIVLRDLGVVDSIRHGWRVLRENVGDILILAVIFFVIGIAFIIVAGLILAPFALAVVVPMLSSFESGNFDAGEILFLIGGGLCLGLVGAALQSILTTWQSATFTLAYLEFTGKKPASVIGDQ